MDRYYSNSDIVIYHADLRDFSAVGPADCVVTSPPYNAGVAYDVHDDSMAEEVYRGLAASAAGLMAASLGAQKGRAWVNIGVTQLRCWLDVLGAAGLSRSTTVAWDYGLSTADTAWGSWQSPSAPDLRYGFERDLRLGWRVAPEPSGRLRAVAGRARPLAGAVPQHVAHRPRGIGGSGAPAGHAGGAGRPDHPPLHMARGDGARSLRRQRHHPPGRPAPGAPSRRDRGLGALLRVSGQAAGPGDPRSRLLMSPEVSPARRMLPTRENV